MPAPRSRSSGRVVVAIMIAGLAVGVAAAEENVAPLPPRASVPLLPPEPPPRPPELGAEPAAAPTVEPESPLPPERPPELADKGAPITLPEPVATPEPPPRPPELSAAAPLTPTIPVPDMPLPPERPPEFSGAPAAAQDAARIKALEPLANAPLPPARPAEMAGDAAQAAALAVPEDAACLRSLDDLGVKYEKLPPIVNGQCTVAHPLNVVTLSEGVGMNSVAVTADQMVVCGVAEGLGRWAKDAQAAAEKELGDRLKGLTLGGGYHCRGQNNVGAAKLSEHAFANAMDIMGFTFAKHAPILVGFLPEDSPEAKFLASVRASACKYFRTVLGPGSNEAHANHLHFDQRGRAGGHRLCELGPPDATNAAQSASAKN